MASLLNDDDRPAKEVDEGSVISDKDAASEAEGLRKRLLDMQKKLQAGRVQPVVQAQKGKVASIPSTNSFSPVLRAGLTSLSPAPYH